MVIYGCHCQVDRQTGRISTNSRSNEKWKKRENKKLNVQEDNILDN
jgi:hypothetical protein